MTEQIPLKPCPFCGHDDPELDGQGEWTMLYVRCPKCKACGPFERTDSEREAIAAWNRRKGEDHAK